jgi:Phosphodiester glycosidase/Biotin protein ligase C terminal domain
MPSTRACWTRDLNDYTFSAYRHARTFVGIDPRGRLLLATADGIPGVSAGLTLTEEAEVMRSLGAVDAMNLDGGGSTQFRIRRPIAQRRFELTRAPGRRHDPSRAISRQSHSLERCRRPARTRHPERARR